MNPDLIVSENPQPSLAQLYLLLLREKDKYSFHSQHPQLLISENLAQHLRLEFGSKYLITEEDLKTLTEFYKNAVWNLSLKAERLWLANELKEIIPEKLNSEHRTYAANLVMSFFSPYSGHGEARFPSQRREQILAQSPWRNIPWRALLPQVEEWQRTSQAPPVSFNFWLRERDPELWKALGDNRFKVWNALNPAKKDLYPCAQHSPRCLSCPLNLRFLKSDRLRLVY